MLKGILTGFIGLLLSFNAFAACRCQPNQSCWPTKAEWHSLSKQLTGRLVQPASPIAACQKNVKSRSCQTALKKIKNPYALQSTPGSLQSQGWMGAWHDQVSAYAVEAANTQDIVAAVNFARQHNLRLVIKGAGHDYLGRSNAPNSLLIWTHNMRRITFNNHFVPKGCSRKTKGIPAITVGAGTRWVEAYSATTTKRHRYVQGGGCTTVGVAGGFTQGGGFGSFSKKFGTGAAGILQVEVVTADGKVRVANQCRNPKLFWAIRGGGGGTFGVVTKMTLMTHQLPKYFGILQGTITAKNDAAYKKLIKHFLLFYRDQLNNPNWGEQFSFNKNNTIKLFMLTQGLSASAVNKVWQPMKNWVKKSKDSVTLSYISIPPTKMWDLHYWEKSHPDLVVANTRKNARPGEYWWAPNSGEVYQYTYTYQSWYFPINLLNKLRINKTSKTIFNASRLTSVNFHINKGLAGASKDAITRGQKTSMNPAVYHAGALIIMAAGSNKVFPGIKGYEPNTKKAKQQVQDISRAMQMIRGLSPNAGAYVNEADYFIKNWQHVFWGHHYVSLMLIKRQYDPKGLFYCHHCVGSEYWTRNGMCRK